jgi:hypothetical protein
MLFLSVWYIGRRSFGKLSSLWVFAHGYDTIGSQPKNWNWNVERTCNADREILFDEGSEFASSFVYANHLMLSVTSFFSLSTWEKSSEEAFSPRIPVCKATPMHSRTVSLTSSERVGGKLSCWTDGCTEYEFDRAQKLRQISRSRSALQWCRNSYIQHTGARQEGSDYASHFSSVLVGSLSLKAPGTGLASKTSFRRIERKMPTKSIRVVLLLRCPFPDWTEFEVPDIFVSVRWIIHTNRHLI